MNQRRNKPAQREPLIGVRTLDQESGPSVGEVFEKFRSYFYSRVNSLAVSLKSMNNAQSTEGKIHSSTKKLQRETNALRFNYK